MVQYIWRLPSNFLVVLIDLYQATLSPDHGPLKVLYPYGFCRHEPTCSMYAKEVLREQGTFVGTLLTLCRLARCNPWTPIHESKWQRCSKI